MKLYFNQTKEKRAFTLVEVMCAAAVAAIILTSVYMGIVTNYSMMDTTRQNLRATQIMVSKLEGIRLCAWQSNQLFSTSFIPNQFQDNFYPQGFYQNSNNKGITYYGWIDIYTNPADFQASFSMTNFPSYTNAMAVVRVTLRWTNGYTVKVPHMRMMTTLVAQNGIQNYISKY